MKLIWKSEPIEVLNAEEKETLLDAHTCQTENRAAVSQGFSLEIVKAHSRVHRVCVILSMSTSTEF